MQGLGVCHDASDEAVSDKLRPYALCCKTGAESHSKHAIVLVNPGEKSTKGAFGRGKKCEAEAKSSIL